jgi:hypothetical protein
MKIKLTNSEFFNKSPCNKVEITINQEKTPSFQMLLPEFLTASNLDIASLRNGFWGPHLHPWPVKLNIFKDGSIQSIQNHPGAFQIINRLIPKDYYIDIECILKNMTKMTIKNVYANFCFSVNGIEWINHDFIPKRYKTTLGKYWFEVLGRRGALVYQRHKWVNLMSDYDSRKDLDAGIIVVKNMEDTKWAFMMWNSSVLNPFINDKGPCMHLNPRISRDWVQGDIKTIQGKAGITSKSLNDVINKYKELTSHHNNI